MPFGESGLLVESILPAGDQLSAEKYWVSLRGWTILEQAPPRLLVIDIGSGPCSTLEVARTLADSMPASVTLLGFDRGRTSENLRDTVETRAREAKLADFEVNTGTGELLQQIAAQSANALFELVILPRNLDGSKAGLDQEVISFLEGADLPVLLAPIGAKAQFSRILVCTRAGEPGKSDIRIAARLSHQLGAVAALLHVSPLNSQVQPQVRRHLDHATATLNALDVRNEIVIRSNSNAAEAIIHEAANYDLVVIGGHGPQARSMFGRDDITLQVLARARCSVLVVPAEE